MKQRHNNNPALVYCYPLDDLPTFTPCAIRWTETYHKFHPGWGHDIHIAFSNGAIKKEHKRLFQGIHFKAHNFQGGGWDIGTYQWMSARLAGDYDFVVFMNARAHFWKEGWLRRLMEAREEKFDPNGLYGPSASFERCPLKWPLIRTGKDPHIRTATFATNPKTFNRYPFLVDSREKGFMFESGQWNFSKWYEDMGYQVWMVTWDGMYAKADWRTPQNVFRKGDQSNLLVCDRHTEMFATGDEQTRIALTKNADGLDYGA